MHEAPTKICRKVIVLMAVEKKQSWKLKIILLNYKNVGKLCDSNPYLALQNF